MTGYCNWCGGQMCICGEDLETLTIEGLLARVADLEAENKKIKSWAQKQHDSDGEALKEAEDRASQLEEDFFRLREAAEAVVASGCFTATEKARPNLKAVLESITPTPKPEEDQIQCNLCDKNFPPRNICSNSSSCRECCGGCGPECGAIE
jgi:hypothetical protein